MHKPKQIYQKKEKKKKPPFGFVVCKNGMNENEKDVNREYQKIYGKKMENEALG